MKIAGKKCKFNEVNTRIHFMLVKNKHRAHDLCVNSRNSSHTMQIVWAFYSVSHDRSTLRPTMESEKDAATVLSLSKN